MCWRKMHHWMGGGFVLVLLVGLVGVSFAADEGPIRPGDTAVVTSDGAGLFVGVKLLATLSKGDRLEVVNIQNGWVGGYVTLDGKRQAGWVRSCSPRQYRTWSEI